MALDLKQVIIKWVTVLIFPMAWQKQIKQKFHCEKDGRHIGERKQASAGKGKKEQQWTEADIDKVFDLWEANSSKKPEERLF